MLCDGHCVIFKILPKKIRRNSEHVRSPVRLRQEAKSNAAPRSPLPGQTLELRPKDTFSLV